MQPTTAATPRPPTPFQLATQGHAARPQGTAAEPVVLTLPRPLWSRRPRLADLPRTCRAMLTAACATTALTATSVICLVLGVRAHQEPGGDDGSGSIAFGAVFAGFAAGTAMTLGTRVQRLYRYERAALVARAQAVEDAAAQDSNARLEASLRPAPPLALQAQPTPSATPTPTPPPGDGDFELPMEEAMARLFAPQDPPGSLG